MDLSAGPVCCAAQRSSLPGAQAFVTGALIPVTGGIEILSPISAIAKGNA